jgi:hypothetical protein
MASTVTNDIPGSDTCSESTWSNPAKISRKVRELAHRSHKVLNERPRPHVPIGEATAGRRDDLSELELRDQVARLQRAIHARRLGVLIPWIDALRRQLEARLGETEKECFQ